MFIYSSGILKGVAETRQEIILVVGERLGAVWTKERSKVADERLQEYRDAADIENNQATEKESCSCGLDGAQSLHY